MKNKIVIDVDLLKQIKELIEGFAEDVEGEWGSGRPLSELIENNDMPDCYYEIVKLLTTR